MKRPTLFISMAIVCSLLAVAAAFISASNQTLDVTKIENVGYVDGSKNYFQSLDLYLPKTDKKSPLVIWIHGGAWRYGDKNEGPGPAFAQHGLAVASLNYRLTDKEKFPAQIQDCKAAVRWLRAHADEYNLDPNKFGVFGMSAGGHLVALLGVTGDDREYDNLGGNRNVSSKVQAVCDWCGPTDLLTIVDQNEKIHGKLKLNGPDGVLTQFLGAAPDKVADLARKASPITFVKSGEPPFLILHGDSDDVVPFAQSQELYEALKKTNNDVQLVSVKNGGHSFGSTDTFIQTYQFFKDKLK
ncbi:MAG TPA: alpha/beta hydrolase [Oculatellaceae cyanobacterium]